MTRPGPDDAVVEAMARGINPVLERDNDIFWAAEYGRPTPEESLQRLARAALTAYRNVTGDDGK